MNILSPIYTEQTECQDCYKCIRQCPVKAIRVEDGHAMIVPELCVMCGRCVINCPARAKHVRDDLGRARQLLTLKDKVIVSLAPSFASEFSEYTAEELVAAIKKLGFFGVSETAVGADLVSAQVAEDLAAAAEDAAEGKTGVQKLFLSSACPAVVEYIKHFLPEYAQFITDRASPLLAHARFLKETYGDDVGVVFIGPCIAKKREADVWKEIDVAITFQDLRNWFASESVTPEKQSGGGQFIPARAAKGSLFPIDGGMIACCKKYDKLRNVRSMAVTGIDEIAGALRGLDNDKLKEPLFIEMLSCVGGCINGPVASGGMSTAIKRVKLLEYAETAEIVLDYPRPLMTGTLPVEDAKEKRHGDDEIRTALRSVGKYVQADELNCASCGYDTCRAFAEAMLDNRAEKTMCVSYMRKLAQKKANSLIQAIPSGVLIADKNLQIVECNKNFAVLMGEDVSDMYDAKPGLEGADLTKIAGFARFFADVLALDGPDVIDREVREGKKIFHVTAFAIEKEEIAGGVIEDVTAPQIRKNRIVTQAQKVITKNLSVVQKIAFLLGENAAETESMLNSIIESFSDENDEGEQ